MINTCWIQGQNQCLAAVIHYPVNNDIGLAAVLVSGYACPMCDTDYFMSKTARKLCDSGLYVIQVDPIGHGDSYGQLSDVTLSTYRESIKNTIQYVQREICSDVVCIGRGLSATLQYELVHQMNIRKIVGINPYNICGNVLAKIWDPTFTGISEISDIYKGKDYKNYSDFDQRKRGFFNALGGSVLNLHGQYINWNLLIELFEFNPRFDKTTTNALWIKCDEELVVTDTYTKIESLNQLLVSCKDEGLPRNPVYQNRIVDCIVNYIVGGR